jgi:hypothetical protein
LLLTLLTHEYQVGFFLYLVEEEEQEYFKLHQLPQGDPEGIRHRGARG